ncbi:MAG TPA: SGNH/GDSL hydrolase family protein [Tepidisphaeraceae bacterium]
MRKVGLILVVLVWVSCARAAPLGFGVLGDSLGDEYQFAPAPRNGAQNYVELLATQRGLNFGAFSTVSRPEPRNQGYEFNFANAGDNAASGVTGPDLFALGEVQGLTPYVASGQVGEVFLTIGGNDFRAIATGGNSATILPALLSSTAAAVQALQSANPNVKVVIANVVDITKVPGAQFTLIQNPALAPLFAALDTATDQYNAQLKAAFAANPNVAIADINAVLDKLLADKSVGGQPIDTLNPGVGPGNLFVDLLHPGTIGQGMIANAFVDASNARFGTSLAGFSDSELLALAAAPPPSVPLPAAAWAGMLCAPLAVWARRRCATSRIPN